MAAREPNPSEDGMIPPRMNFIVIYFDLAADTEKSSEQYIQLSTADWDEILKR